jgi:ABC-type branched-subunit amino acid transport system substrate-binding protein
VTSGAAGTTKLDTAGGNYVFRTVPSDSYDGKVAAHVLWEKGFRKISILFENDEGRRSIANAVIAEFEKLGGKVVSQVPFNPRQTTYSAELKAAFDAKPDAVWIGAGQESGPILLKDWKQRGYGGQLMVASDLAVPEIFKLVDPKTMEGILTEMPSAKTDTPQYERFAKKYRELFNMEPGGGFQSNYYDAMILLALAMEKAGQATGEGINAHIRDVANPPGTVVHSFEEGVAELRKGNDINYEGASGPCDFNEYGNVSGSYVAMEARNGKWVETKFYEAGSF